MPAGKRKDREVRRGDRLGDLVGERHCARQIVDRLSNGCRLAVVSAWLSDGRRIDRSIGFCQPRAGGEAAALREKRAMRALYLGLAALVTPAHALGKPDITFILGAPRF